MRTFLIGLDGATFTVLDDLVARGVMPNLARFYAQGARAPLGSTPMPITPQAWTSMGTGRSAGHHGLHDFVRFEIGSHGVFLRLNNATENHCEWMWKYLSRRGRKVTILNWFGIAPPEPVNGHTMPGFTSGRHLKRSSWPPDLFERLKQVDGFDVNLLGLDLDIERKGLSELDRAEWLEWIHHHTRREAVWYGVLDHLASSDPADFSAVVFDGVDKIQHLSYRYIDPALVPAKPDAWEQEVVDACRDYFATVDGYIGKIVERAGSWGRVFIVSDHGFTSSHEIFYLNKWLEDQGWLTWKANTKVDASGQHYSESLGADANSIDVTKSKAYCLSPGSNGIYLNVPEAEYESFRAEVIAKLLEVRGADGGRVVTEAKRREDCLPGPYNERVPHLLLTLRDHGFVAVLRGPEWVVARDKPLGTHHPDGVLLALGPGVRAGAKLDRLDLLDVAPLVVHSVGEEIPAEYEGRFPEELYDPGYLVSDRPRRAAAAAGGNGPEAERTTAVPDEEEEAIVLERLRSLGYLE